jgi:hypothetical protein
MVSLWALVFHGCCHSQQQQDTTTTITNAAEDPCETSCLEPIRGALPDTALRFYLQKSNMDSCNELLNLVKQIYNTALTNAEALRKLVKKFDKQHKKRLSFSLLPEVYGASFTVGQATLQAGISLIRANLGLEEGYDDYDEDETGFVDTYQNADAHDKSVRRRKEELDWLKRLVAEIVKVGEIDHLVAHRGFHSVLDRSDCRPLENSLAAYEACWTSGIPICECDIALTKDEKVRRPNEMCAQYNHSILFVIDTKTSFVYLNLVNLFHVHYSWYLLMIKTLVVLLLIQQHLFPKSKYRN